MSFLGFEKEIHLNIDLKSNPASKEKSKTLKKLIKKRGWWRKVLKFMVPSAQLRQIIRKFPTTNFYYINRTEYIEANTFLRWYFDQPNIKIGIYADLQRWISSDKDKIKWRIL